MSDNSTVILGIRLVREHLIFQDLGEKKVCAHVIAHPLTAFSVVYRGFREILDNKKTAVRRTKNPLQNYRAWCTGRNPLSALHLI